MASTLWRNALLGWVPDGLLWCRRLDVRHRCLSRTSDRKAAPVLQACSYPRLTRVRERRRLETDHERRKVATRALQNITPDLKNYSCRRSLHGNPTDWDCTVFEGWCTSSV